MSYVIVGIFVILSGIFSGLTLGLMSLNPHELKRKIKLGDKNALKIYHLRERGNLLLATLLTGNTLVNATISVVLGSLVESVIAIVISTMLILILGEIIPQAIFSRHGVRLGGYFAWFLGLLRVIFWPVTAPIAYILDRTLGAELPTIYSRKELEMIIEEHEDSPDSDLGEHEEGIIKGALSFGKKTIEDIYTPLTQVMYFMDGDILTQEALDEIRDSGFSRIPIFKKDFEGTLGVFYAKTLIGTSCEGTRPVTDYLDKDVYTLKETMHLSDALQFIQNKRKHLFVVENEFGVILGIVTLEDILEEILSFEIVDESDEHVDLRIVALEESEN